MNIILRLATLAVFVFVFTIISFGQSAGASPIYEIKFVKGRFVTKGSVSPPPICTPDSPTECGESGMTFSLRGRKGDKIRIVLNSEEANARARFAIETPRRNPMNGYNGDSWTGTLRTSGDYMIYVWIEKGTTPFTLTVIRH